jgi:hypothetical protein
MMKEITRKLFGKRLLLACVFLTIMSQAWSQDKMMDILKAELQREKKAFDTCKLAPYYVSYRIEDTKKQVIETKFGALTTSQENHKRIFTPNVRVGSYQFDNFHPVEKGNGGGTASTEISFDDNAKAIQQTI